MTLNNETVAPLLDSAQRLVEPVTGLADRLRDHLDTADGVFDYTQSPHTTTQTAACVDGAVADDQTDALVWVTAVGVAHTDGRANHTATTSAVVPVSGDTERLRSALMATCELSASTAWKDRMVFIDGGLATPLISVAQGLTVRDPDVAASIEQHYQDSDITEVVNTYLDRLLVGKIAALPKQDTATGYIDLWTTSLGDSLPDSQRQMLSRLRDRPVISGLLQPGEMLHPRPATELTRTEAKSPEGYDASSALDDAYGRMRQADGLHVTYFKPTRLPTRVIKVEYLERDPDGFTDGRTLAAMLDTQTRGPRMKEPLMQHQVDQAAKRLVTANLSTITSMAARAIDNPSATGHYRT